LPADLAKVLMAPRRTNPHRQPSRAAGDDRLPDGEAATVVRRAPFSDNPQVGVRGHRTQQRILAAALHVFGEEGYHQSGIDRITTVAGCSRASFYQYFSGKEDVFRQLAGQVARQLSASIEALGPLTADADGWVAIRAWVARYVDIYDRYEPVFRAFQAAAESDEAIAGGSARTGERHVASLRSRLATTTLPPRRLDPVIKLVLECLPRTLDIAGILRAATPVAYPTERTEDALADVVHRTLFGLQAAVNVHAPEDRRRAALSFGPVMRDALVQADAAPQLNAAGRRTLHALMQAGRDVFVARGYHRTRVDDVVAAAGLSHGAFYRYFQSKDHFARTLAVRAMLTVSTALADIPAAAFDGSAGTTALRRWLRRYNATQATEAAMIRVWVDAALDDDALRADSAAAFDWGRRRVARFLRPRDFGDVDTEAIVMVALLAAFGARERSAAMIDAAAHVIERGFLGR
jgi:AcrR family transcriptional regulator